MQLIESIKTFLKQRPHVYRVVTFLKARKITNIYRTIVSAYGAPLTPNSKEVSSSFRYAQGKIDPIAIQIEHREQRIFYLGTDEHQDNSGLLQSLSRFGDVKYFTKHDGSYGQYGRKDNNWKERNKQRMMEIFKKNAVNKWIPDILLMQTWEWRIGKETLEWIKLNYPECKIVNIGWDDRHAYWENGNAESGTAALSPYLDLALTSTPEAVQWFQQEGVDALFWPEASCPEFFYPINCTKKYQVGFVGASYGIRKEIVSALKAAGIEVKAFGNGWPSGRLPLEETNTFFNECQIVLGCGTIKQCRDFFALKLRDFDAPMSGSVYVTHHNEDLADLFKIDLEIITCKSVDEFIYKIRDLLSNPVRCENIRIRARKRAIDEHTFDQRFALMLHHLNSGV